MNTRSGNRLLMFAMCNFVLLMALAWFAATAEAANRLADETTLTVYMTNSDGESVGTVEVVGLTQGVLLVTHLKNLPAGAHGFHIHERGQCKQPDFQSAGGHYNPASKEHGLDNPDGPHAGDLPNLIVSEDGTAEATFFVSRLYLGEVVNNEQTQAREAARKEGPPFPLLDGNGSAIIIHKHADNYDAEPPAVSGPRIACGAIRWKEMETGE